jgi:hypothetical protein
MERKTSATIFLIAVIIIGGVFYFLQTKETFTVEKNFYQTNRSTLSDIEKQLNQNVEFMMGMFPPPENQEFYVKLSNANRQLTPHQKYVAAYWFLDYLQAYKLNDMSLDTFNRFIYGPIVALLQLKNNKSKTGKTINVGKELGILMTIFWRK